MVEVHRIINPEQCEAMDLLDRSPAPFVLHDRRFAAMAGRFSQILAWVFPLPHYWRLHHCGSG